MQRGGRDTGIFELVGQLFGERAGAGEDQRLAIAGRELLDNADLVALLDTTYVDRRRKTDSLKQ